MTDVYCTHSNVVNANITELNLTKFIYSVEISLTVNYRKLELRYCHQFWNASVPNESGYANCGHVTAKKTHYADNLRDYWSELH